MNKFNTIIQGDCLDKFKQISDNYIDLLVTSPPYNLDIKYNSYADNIERTEYLNWLDYVFINISRVLKETGSFFLNIGASNKDPWIYMDVANIARKHFCLQNDIVWVKSIAVGAITHGHFKPINSKRYLNHTYEHLFHFTKNGTVKLDRNAIGVPYMDKTNINRWEHNKNHDLRCKGNCWHIPYLTINSKLKKGNHPATFPEELVEHCIKLHGHNSDTILLDPFSGTGTTSVVAKKLHINSIGIELDPYYVEYSMERLANV